MILNYKYEIYPTEEQSQLLTSWTNICRQTYNSALIDKNRAYKNEKRKLNRMDLQRIQTADKKEKTFLKKVPSQPQQEVFVRLENSFKKFFRKEAGYPKLKSEKDYNSITFTQFGIFVQKSKKNSKKYVKRRAVSLGKGGKLQISGLGLVDIKFHRKLDGRVKQVIVKRQANRWYAVFSVQKTAKNDSSINPNNSVGIDVGIKKFAVLSNGEEIHNPKFLRKAEKRLKRTQQRLSKRKKVRKIG